MRFFVLLGLFWTARARFPSFYHTTNEIFSEIQNLCQNTPHFTCKDHYVVVKGSTKQTRLYSFGEHAREVITSEIALALLKEWVSHPPKSLTVVQPVVNEWGRKKVERGDLCLRKNERGVDLNRNYPPKKKHFYSKNGEEYQGPFPLSEKESQKTAHLMKQYAPQMFINIHSGEFALYTAFDAVTTHPAHYTEMERFLSQWKKYCPQCLVGEAAEKSSYKAYGTAGDYAISLGIPMAFTFEVYGTETRNCFRMFNPTTSRQYETIIAQWVQILK